MQDSDQTLAMKKKDAIALATSIQQAPQLPGTSVILGLSPSTERPKQCLQAPGATFSLKVSGWMHQSQLVTAADCHPTIDQGLTC